MSTCADDSEDGGGGEPALDFLSGEFDPLRALRASPGKVALPWPAVQPCDNLDMYESVVKGTRNVYTAPEKGAEPTGSKEVGVAKSAPPPKQPNTVLRFMQEPQNGPFSLLQRCLGNGAGVRVVTRHCAGVRGVCEGVLLAFDKHFNLVLGAVSEEYCPFRTVANGGARGKRKRVRRRKGPPPPSLSSSSIAEGPSLDCVQPDILTTTATQGAATVATSHVTDHVTTKEEEEDSHVTRSNPGKERISRTFKRLFIRGDSVVMVSPKGS